METDQPAAAPPQPSTQLPPPPPAAADAAQASAPTSEQPPSARMPAPLPPPAQPAKPTSRRKGGRGRGGGPTVNQTADMVRLGAEIPIGSERLRSGWRPVRLSADDKAADVEVDDAQLAASSRAGYRMVRATHGACSGTWYFEVRIDVLGPSGAARVGWSTRQGELNAPVGADDKGFSYRSLQGSKVRGQGEADPLGVCLCAAVRLCGPRGCRLALTRYGAGILGGQLAWCCHPERGRAWVQTIHLRGDKGRCCRTPVGDLGSLAYWATG